MSGRHGERPEETAFLNLAPDQIRRHRSPRDAPQPWTNKEWVLLLLVVGSLLLCGLCSLVTVVRIVT